MASASRLVSLYADEVGNPQLPRKIRTLQKRRAQKRWTGIVAVLLLLAAIAAAFLIILRRPAAATSRVSEKSIAVLPFENLSDEKANAYFADGIQDEILTRLSKIADLKVISRTSTQHYKSAPENLPRNRPTTWRRQHRGRKRAEERRRRARERAADQSGQ